LVIGRGIVDRRESGDGDMVVWWLEEELQMSGSGLAGKREEREE
jgi:hypothetical protein